jgi:outer membrane protein assembly factor BamB
MSNISRLTFLILIAACSASSFAGQPAAAAGDWPCWRGPNRDGKSTEIGLLKQWPAGGPKLLWSINNLGIGYSTVSIVGGKIFTMGDGPDSSNLIALDAKDGKQLWTAKVGAPGGNYPGPRCTPTVDGNLVYALGHDGALVCVQAADGKEVWRKSMKKDFGGVMMSGWGYSESPLVDGPLLVITPGGPKGTLAALNKQTGATVWQSKDFTDAAAYTAPIMSEYGGVRQYMTLTAENVAGVNANDGSLLWKAARKGETAVIPTPVFHDGMLFVTSGYKVGCNMFKITAENKQFKAEQVYANKEMQNHHGGVILVGDHIYGLSDPGQLVCMELKSGKVAWKDKSVGKGSIAYADGHFYVRSEGGGGTVALVEASPEGYKEKGRFDQPQRSKQNSWAHPVIAGGKLYLRDQGVLLCYDISAK